MDQVPAQVTAAAPNDCGNQANTVAGLAHCLIAMTRKYAPNTAVGLHLTCWDFPGNVPRCGKDYVTLGAPVRTSWSGRLKPRTPASTPCRRMADTTHSGATRSGPRNSHTGRRWRRRWPPIVVWQIPLGNMQQDNTPYHYQDDKVDWLFSHMDQVASAHVAGLLFGQGSDKSTTAETDGGNLSAKTIAYRNSGGTPLR